MLFIGKRSMFHLTRKTGKLHSSSFYLSYLMVALPVLLITNALFYLIFVPRYQQEVMQINSETVKGIKMSFDQHVTSYMDQTYLNLLIRDTTIDITYPLQDPRHGDTWKIYQAHQHMKSLVNDSNALLKRVDVYYNDAQFINGSAGYLDADNKTSLLYPAWVELIDLSKEFQWQRSVEERRYSVISPSTEEVVYYYRSFPASTNPLKRKMTVVFTLSTQHLQEFLVNHIGFSEYQMTLMASDGTVLISTKGEPPAMEDISFALNDSGASGKTFHLDQNIVTVITSARGDLHFVFSIPKSYYFHNTNQIRWQILTISSIALLVILALSRVISHKMYSPIAVINQAASNALTAIGLSSSNHEDSYQTIHQALDALSTRVQSLDGQLSEYLPRLRTNFYRDLLFSGRLGQLAVEERMTALGIPQSENYRVVMFHFSDEFKEPSSTDYLKMKIIEFIRSFDSDTFRTFVTLHEEDSLISVFSYEEENDMERLLDELALQLWKNEYHIHNVHVAVGKRKSDILGVRTSMRQAQETLCYGFLFPQRILRYETYADWENTKAKLPCTDAERLFALITDLSSPQAKQAAEDFINELREQVYSQPISYNYLHFSLLEILISCIELISKRGVFIDKLYVRDIFDRYERSGTFDEYEDTLRCMLTELTERMQMKRGNANYDTVTMVQQYVQEHLQDQLSLKLVSEHFHISYSHMSKVFKEISGMNFTEYVLQCRLEESIHLLLETNLNLETIAEKVGIYNAGYYIRTFKARYGMTPKQYRLSHVQT